MRIEFETPVRSIFPLQRAWETFSLLFLPKFNLFLKAFHIQEWCRYVTWLKMNFRSSLENIVFIITVKLYWWLSFGELNYALKQCFSKEGSRHSLLVATTCIVVVLWYCMGRLIVFFRFCGSPFNKCWEPLL